MQIMVELKRYVKDKENEKGDRYEFYIFIT